MIGENKWLKIIGLMRTPLAQTLSRAQDSRRFKLAKIFFIFSISMKNKSEEAQRENLDLTHRKPDVKSKTLSDQSLRGFYP